MISISDYRDVLDRTFQDDQRIAQDQRIAETPAARSAIAALNLTNPITTRTQGYNNITKLTGQTFISGTHKFLTRQAVISEESAISTLKRNQ